MVMGRSVNEDDWFARALLNVLQAKSIDLNLSGSWGIGYHYLLL
jgi:hypothetical protein